MENKNSQNSSSPDPYLVLGINPGASFDEIQKAKEQKLLEIGEDLIEKAKIESSYDLLLMGSLKARKLGKVSSEAKTASEKEDLKIKEKTKGVSLLTKIKSLGNSEKSNNSKKFIIDFNFSSGQNLSLKISIAIFAIILVIVLPVIYDRLLLSLSTLSLFFFQIKSGRKFFSSLGISILLLSIGLLFGGLISNANQIEYVQTYIIEPSKLKVLPSIILLWIGIILL